MNNRILQALIIAGFSILLSSASMQASVSPLNKTVSLSKAIKEISKDYNVYFTYDHELVENIEVEYEYREVAVTEAVAVVLEKTTLNFRLFDNRYIILYSETKEGLESLRKMMDHLSGILIQEKISKNEFEVEEMRSAEFSLKTKPRILDMVEPIKGVVMNEDNEPLIGVNITVKDREAYGTITDIDGGFTLADVSDTDILLISYIGYRTQEVSINGLSSFTIILESDAALLDEVVVTALGLGKRQKREIGYSTESLKGDVVIQSSTPNIVNALSGKIAGAQIIQPNGVEGGTTKIVLRGNNTFTGNNQPLIVIDGMPLENDPGLTSMTSGKDWGSAINNINPNDIESFDVLKGPNAAALYGARGANGVIIITTKKGGKTDGVGIEYSVDFRVIDPYLYRDVQNNFGGGGPAWGDTEPRLTTNGSGQLVLPSFWANTMGTGGGTSLEGRPSWDIFSWFGPGASWGAAMNNQDVLWWDGNSRKYSPQADNLKSFFKTGSTTSHTLAFSSGGDFGSVRLSVTYKDHESVDYNSNLDQVTVNLGGNLNISKKLKANYGISYINYNRLNSPELGESDRRQTTSRISSGKYLLYNWGRDYQPLDKGIYQNEDGTQNQFWKKPAGAEYTGFNDYEAYGYFYDYWWRIYNNNETLSRDKLLGTVNLSYEVTPWLSLTGRIATDLTFDNIEQKNKPTDLTGINGGLYSQNSVNGKVFNSEIFATFSKDNILDNVNAKLTIGGTQWSRESVGNKFTTARWLYPWSYSLGNVATADDLKYEGSVYTKKIRSTLGVLDLSYKDYLYVQFTGRNDMSSTLPENSNSYFFPSASVSLVASEFLPSLKEGVISFAKLRMSYAEAASDADPYQNGLQYNPGRINGQLTTALPNRVPASELANSTNKGYEIGLSIGLFKDRLNFDLAHYRNRSYNQIFSAPLPTSSGATSFTFNNGEITNRGFELSMDYAAVKSRNFAWDIGLRASKNISNIVEIDGDAEFLELGSLWGAFGPSIRLKKGDQYGTIYGYGVQRDAQGRKILSNDGTRYLTTPDKVKLGNTTPDALVGLTNSIRYKNFSLSTLIDASVGGDMFSGTYAYSVLTGQDPSTLPERLGEGLPYTDTNGETRNVGVVLEGVLEDGTVNDQVVHYLYKYMGNTGSGWGNWKLRDGRSYYYNHEPAVFDNTYVKIRELSLSYSLSQKVLNKTKVFQNILVYVTARDLGYIYKNIPSNINPEGSNGSGNAQGFEWAALPGMRSFSVGLRTEF